MPARKPIQFDGELARRLRKDRALSIADLAGALQVSESSIKMYERGQRQPGDAVTRTLADILGVDPATLAPRLPDLADATLADIRRALRFSATDIAEQLQVSVEVVWLVERGERLPDRAPDWAQAYRLTVEQLRDAWLRCTAAGN